MKTKTLIIRLMYLSVALAGLMTAIIILVSPGGNAVGKGISTAFLIFVADGFILLGLLAKHEWLKIGTWITAIYSLIFATIYTWMPKSKFDDYDRYGSDQYGATRIDEIAENANTMAHWMWGGYIIAVIFVQVVLFSCLRASIVSTDKIMHYAYYSTLLIGITSGFVLALCASIDQGGLLLRFGFALLFLALTAAAITGISLVVASIKRRSELREQKSREYLEYQNANPNVGVSQMQYPGQPYNPNSGYNSYPPPQGYGPHVYSNEPNAFPPTTPPITTTPSVSPTEHQNPTSPPPPPPSSEHEES